MTKDKFSDLFTRKYIYIVYYLVIILTELISYFFPKFLIIGHSLFVLAGINHVLFKKKNYELLLFLLIIPAYRILSTVVYVEPPLSLLFLNLIFFAMVLINVELMKIKIRDIGFHRGKFHYLGIILIACLLLGFLAKKLNIQLAAGSFPTLLTLIILSGFAEEVYFRGILTHFTKRFAIILIPLLYSIFFINFGYVVFLYVLVVNVFLTFAFQFYRNVYLVILGHLIINLMLIL